MQLPSTRLHRLRAQETFKHEPVLLHAGKINPLSYCEFEILLSGKRV